MEWTRQKKISTPGMNEMLSYCYGDGRVGCLRCKIVFMHTQRTFAVGISSPHENQDLKNLLCKFGGKRI